MRKAAQAAAARATAVRRKPKRNAPPARSRGKKPMAAPVTDKAKARGNAVVLVTAAAHAVAVATALLETNITRRHDSGGSQGPLASPAPAPRGH